MKFLPSPLQQPRIPIWVGGYWPKKAPFRRGARWDGVFPLKHHGALTPKDVTAIKEFIYERQEIDSPFDLVVMGYLRKKLNEKRQKTLDALETAGVTWWLESYFQLKHSFRELLAQFELGPPTASSR